MKLAIFCVAGLLIAGTDLPKPDDLETAYQSLQQATASKDAAQVRKYAAQSLALARQVISQPAPEDPDQKEAWTKSVAYARDVEQYTEYALYSVAVQSPPAATADLLAALEQQNPKSKYLAEAYGAYLLAVSQTAGQAKAIAVAEKAIEHFPDNEDLLLVLADSALSRKQTDRALRYAERTLNVFAGHGRPEGISQADWDRKRASATTRAHWIAGMVHAEKGQHYEAIRDLRACLPAIQGNEAMLAPALFHLGVANYQLGRAAMNKAQVLEGIKYSEQCAAIKGPLSQQAWRNAQVMKAEAQKLR